MYLKIKNEVIEAVKPEKEEVKITGTVKKIRFKNEDNGFTIFSFEEENTENIYSVTGTFFKLEENDAVTLSGVFTNHPKFGQQFKASHYELYMPKDMNALRGYLSNGLVKGIGPVLADRLIEKFGSDTFDVLSNHPEKLREIEGIGKRKANLICKRMEERTEMQNAMIFLSNYGITQGLGTKIYRFYKDRMYEILQTNPYKMIEDLKGVGFKTADDIALKNGISKCSVFRLNAGIISLLDQAKGSGSICYPYAKLVKESSKTLDVEEDKICNRIHQMLDAEVLVSVKAEKETYIYKKSDYKIEIDTAIRVVSLCKKMPHKKVNLSDKKLDSTQQGAVQIAVDNGFMVLTGGPGTGKTTTTNLIIDYFIKNRYKVSLAAPTGRAAKRMQEATGKPASTIHRLLEVGPDGFAKNEDDPLECQVLIIDEISMIDLYLMHSLLLAIKSGTRVILVGDKNQLPSVGPGNVLSDIINSGICPVVELKKIYRQAEGSYIIGNSHHILNNEPLELKGSKDFFFKQEEDPEKILQHVLHYTVDSLPGFTGESEIQVLSPIKQRLLGVENLNKELQNKINPYNQDVLGFRVNDKVIQMRNDYSRERTFDNGKIVVGVFNGDMGRIIKIDKENEYIYVRFEDGSVVKYEFDERENLALAYALTIHKSQGSEYPVVVIPIYDFIPMLTTRNLIYTGVTRAKKAILLIGSYKKMQLIIRNMNQNKRYSNLKDELNKLQKGEK